MGLNLNLKKDKVLIGGEAWRVPRGLAILLRLAVHRRGQASHRRFEIFSFSAAIARELMSCKKEYIFSELRAWITSRCWSVCLQAPPTSSEEVQGTRDGRGCGRRA